MQWLCESIMHEIIFLYMEIQHVSLLDLSLFVTTNGCSDIAFSIFVHTLMISKHITYISPLKSNIYFQVHKLFFRISWMPPQIFKCIIACIKIYSQFPSEGKQWLKKIVQVSSIRVHKSGVSQSLQAGLYELGHSTEFGALCKCSLCRLPSHLLKMFKNNYRPPPPRGPG